MTGIWKKVVRRKSKKYQPQKKLVVYSRKRTKNGYTVRRPQIEVRDPKDFDGYFHWHEDDEYWCDFLEFVKRMYEEAFGRK
jgi:hypothetical protein